MHAANSEVKIHRHKLRRRFDILGVGLVVIGLFYAEENWRGKRAWEQCNRALVTQGIALEWTHYIPAAVPENQNIFGVPEMVRWFDGRNGAGWSDFARVLPSETYPAFNTDNHTARMLV